MAGPYFQRKLWQPFSHNGAVHNLAHLDESYFTALDSQGNNLRIAVTYSDHCFTIDPITNNAALIYPGCSRNPGHFCPVRYGLSQTLPLHVAGLALTTVFLLRQEESYALIKGVTAWGQPCAYRIIFTLNPVTGLPAVDLHLYIKTAYPATIPSPKPFPRFGKVKFANLIYLRMHNKSPRRNPRPIP